MFQLYFNRIIAFTVLVTLGLFFSLPTFASLPDGFIKSIDIMKFTKDTLHNQPSDSEIENIVNVIAEKIKPTHIAISIPLDANNNYPQPPKPRTAEAFTYKWAQTIHSKNIKIIWRGTFSGIEGIYGFQKLVGVNRFPTGTVTSAPSDGDTTWLGKIYKYITSHPEFFANGDIWASLPERTEGIFKQETSFLPYEGGIQTNYANFFSDLEEVSRQAFQKIGKQIITGYTANNYSELGSTWLPRTSINSAGIAAIDHYGITHTSQEMESDIRKINKYYGKPVFLQEWGDYWNRTMPESQRLDYLKNMYSVFEKLASEKILVGFNYWGGWVNDLEGILVKQSNGYNINSRGELLASFYQGDPAPIILPSTSNTNNKPEEIIATPIVEEETTSSPSEPEKLIDNTLPHEEFYEEDDSSTKDVIVLTANKIETQAAIEVEESKLKYISSFLLTSMRLLINPNK